MLAKRGAVLLFLIVGLYVGVAYAQTEEELSKKRLSPPVAQRLLLPFFLDNQERGDMQVLIPANPAEMRLEAAPLLRELASVVQPSILQQLKQAVDSQGHIRLQTLTDTG